MTEIPSHLDLMWPTLQALDELGGSARRGELRNAVLKSEHLTEAQLEVVYPPESKLAGQPKVSHRIDWAMTYLVRIGATEIPTRGLQVITPRGRAFLSSPDTFDQQRDDLVKALNKLDHQSSDQRPSSEASAPVVVGTIDVTEAADNADVQDDESWKAALLQRLVELSPKQFETLCARLLREEGCEDVRVTGGANDQGIDGTATLRISLLSFPVFFQAKRYKADNTIGPSTVRELRGALQGRGDKGILLTTSSFTPLARDEANRAGSPVDLIDGDQLCDLLVKHGLGVEPRPTVVASYFDNL